jgi:hypothetical protein
MFRERKSIGVWILLFLFLLAFPIGILATSIVPEINKTSSFGSYRVHLCRTHEIGFDLKMYPDYISLNFGYLSLLVHQPPLCFIVF